MIEDLKARIKQALKSLLENRGYRKNLKISKGSVSLGHRKIQAEVSFDGKLVLQTNNWLSFEEEAHKYRELWLVEHVSGMSSPCSTHAQSFISLMRQSAVIYSVVCSS